MAEDGDRERIWRIADGVRPPRPHRVGDLEITGDAGLRLHLRRTSIDGIRVVGLAATPHSATWVGPTAPGGAVLVLLVSGRARVAGGATLTPGAVAAAIPGPEFTYVATEPVRAVAVVLMPPVAPPHLTRFTTPLVVQPDERGRTTAAFAALLLPLAAGPMDADGATGLVAQGVADLALAVLAELVPGGTGDGQDVLRFRAHEFIEQHLAERELDPSAVAAAVGVSPRSLQALFHGEGTSVARSIRERRLDLAARSLREDAEPPGTAELAAKVGFAGPDQFTRAFRARFGQPPFSYRAEQRSA